MTNARRAGHALPGRRIEGKLARPQPVEIVVDGTPVAAYPGESLAVVTIASGLLSLKQFTNGIVLVGGGWQGQGDREHDEGTLIPDNLLGNLRLAAHAVPALRAGRLVRAWLGLEAETADAMPAIGPVPGIADAFIIGSVHSGFTSGPYMGRLLADQILGRHLERPLFAIDRLLQPAPASATEVHAR